MMSDFARAVYHQKYAMEVRDEDPTLEPRPEEWHETARRVATNVLGALPSL